MDAVDVHIIMMKATLYVNVVALIMKQAIIPEDKLSNYIEYCEESSNKFSAICKKCKQVVEVKLHPYFYDEDENDIYFAGICPVCGELFIMKE